MFYFQHLDTCYPDFFQGCSHETLAVSVHSKMRYGELKRALYEEVNATSSEMLTKVTEDYINNAVNDLFSTVDLRTTFYPDVIAEDITIMAYFAVVPDDND